jgi:hypothetical protein
MRYITAMAVALGVGVAMAAPAAFAGENAGPTCYVNGAASSCVQPATVVLNAASGTGTLAGSMGDTWSSLRGDQSSFGAK